MELGEERAAGTANVGGVAKVVTEQVPKMSELVSVIHGIAVNVHRVCEVSFAAEHQAQGFGVVKDHVVAVSEGLAGKQHASEHVR